jgi:hypothetical protein
MNNARYNSLSLALDDSDNPHLSYIESVSNNNNLKYAHWVGDHWDIQIVESAGLM